MKRWSIILAATLVAVWMVVDMVREFFANETIHYFSSQPQRLLYVAVIAIAGGLVALGYDRLSPRARRQVRVFAWGTAASALTTVAGYFAFRFISLSSFIAESGDFDWVVIAPMSLAVIAAYLWFEFYRALKANDSH
jgi:hypothetical protein